ncbi:hypothetical protein [Brevifollis gellanilyticus]|uniref:Uncharacterized protein n=1 Tax=Brevifollis gellanilyticus TaxID=748831 RepID=A0A512M950_9BACT|nr:hypothetical protein [Brevifollis gellanilyticus]GEP43267.1 hypothetical protein BGE01nite_25580 [Brevifollis gellanilyticus]
MKRFGRILALGLILGALAFVIYQLRPPSEAGQKAMAQLAGAQTFSLGAVGPGGSISKDEDLFFAVLASRHSSQLFGDLFERGTPEARLYALCGLRLTRGDFEGCAKRFTRDCSTVSTVSGCIGRDIAASEMVSAIREGMVEQYLHFRHKLTR